MSQKKMEAYKQAKKNKKQIEKKQKRNKILGWMLGLIIAAALIGGSVYMVYYTSVILPNKQNAENEAAISTEELNLEDLSSEETGEDTTGEDTSLEETTDAAPDDAAEDTTTEEVSE